MRPSMIPESASECPLNGEAHVIAVDERRDGRRLAVARRTHEPEDDAGAKRRGAKHTGAGRQVRARGGAPGELEVLLRLRVVPHAARVEREHRHRDEARAADGASNRRALPKWRPPTATSR